MATFQIFTYQFREDVAGSQLDMLDEAYNQIDVKEMMERKQDLFEAEWKNEKDWVFKVGKTEYKHKLLEHRDHIVVFRIANNKKLHKEQDFHEVEIDHKPSCMVIIDNRAHRQQIAIQSNKAFSSPVRVGKILESVFSERMKQHKLVVEINPRYEVREFWELVDRDPNGVSYLKFTFTPKNLPWLIGDIKRMFNDIGENFKAEPSLELKSFDKAPLGVSKEDDMLKELLEVSAASGKVILVKMVDSRKTIKCGEKTNIVQPLGDNVMKHLDDDNRRTQLVVVDSTWENVVEFVNEIKLLHEGA